MWKSPELSKLITKPLVKSYQAFLVFLTYLNNFKKITDFFSDTPSWVRLSWTSGKFLKKYGNKESFTFDNTGETWTHKDNQNHWNWIEQRFIMNASDELCMLIVNASSSALTTIRPIVCDMRNYFICYKDQQVSEQPCLEPTLINSKFTEISTKFIRTGANSKYLYPEKMILVEPRKALEICAELKLQPANVETLADYLHIWELISKNEFPKKFGVDEENLFSVMISGSAKDKPGIYLTSEEKLLPFQLFSLQNFYYYVSTFYHNFNLNNTWLI